MTGEYLTTTQAAQMCDVTRFTIANWVKKGKLKSSRTAGGHRRISKNTLRKFMTEHNIAKIGEKNCNYLIPSCWEVKGCDSSGKHNCAECFVFKAKANRCFLLVRRFGMGSIQCQEECHKCRYLRKYYPKEKKIMEKIEGKVLDDIQRQIRREGSTFSTFLEKGFYASGKYLGVIKKAFSKEKKEVENVHYSVSEIPKINSL